MCSFYLVSQKLRMSVKYCKSRIQRQNYHFWDSKIVSEVQKNGECILRRFSLYRVLGRGRLPVVLRDLGAARVDPAQLLDQLDVGDLGPAGQHQVLPRPDLLAPARQDPQVRLGRSSVGTQAHWHNTLCYAATFTSNCWLYVNLSEWLYVIRLWKRIDSNGFYFWHSPVNFYLVSVRQLLENSSLFSVTAEWGRVWLHRREGGGGAVLQCHAPTRLPLPGCHTSHCHAAAGVKLGPGNPSTSLPTPPHCRGQGCHPATTGGSKGFHCPQEVGGASLHFCFGIIYLRWNENKMTYNIRFHNTFSCQWLKPEKKRLVDNLQTNIT